MRQDLAEENQRCWNLLLPPHHQRRNCRLVVQGLVFKMPEGLVILWLHRRLPISCRRNLASSSRGGRPFGLLWPVVCLSRRWNSRDKFGFVLPNYTRLVRSLHRLNCPC